MHTVKSIENMYTLSQYNKDCHQKSSILSIQSASFEQIMLNVHAPNKSYLRVS